MNDCEACWLGPCSLQTNVGGRGSGTIMVVGMNPGSREVMEGQPFVGPSGQLLDEMLRSAGIRAGVRFTNAVRCEGKPDPVAIDTCRMHLKAEIHEQKPEVIIALGDIALQSLCKKSGITSKRGQSFPLHKDFGYDCDVYPTIHPGSILHGSGWAKDIIVADLRRVRDRNVVPNQNPWVWAADRMPQGSVLAWDIETIDAEKQFTRLPTQTAVAGANGIVVAPEERSYGIACGLVAAEDAGATLVTHNGWDFDVPRMREATGVDVPWGEDTMVLAFLDDENQPLGLEACAVKYLGVPGWKEAKYAPLGSDEFAQYNANDAAITRKLWAVLRQRLGKRARIATEIILPAKLALDAATRRGVGLDPGAIEQARIIFEGLRDAARAAIDEHAPGLNPNSPKQVGEALGTKGTDKGVLQAMGTPLADAILAYRSASKMLSTYVDAYKILAESGDGRAHGEYRLYKRDRGDGGTVVGRSSCSKPNVQNVPRELEERGIDFFAPAKGRVVWKADYATMHIRLAAQIAGERTILDHYAQDARWDAHSWFRDHSGLPITRQVAKSANFALLYLGTGFTLMEYLAKQQTHMPIGECDAVHVAWHKALPAFRPWYDATEAFLREHGYVESLTGMRRNFGPVNTFGQRDFGECHRQAVNFLVLSLEADIAKLALGAAHGDGHEIVRFVHDSIEIENDGDEPDFERLMVREPVRILHERFDVRIVTPLVVDVSRKEFGGQWLKTDSH